MGDGGPAEPGGEFPVGGARAARVHVPPILSEGRKGASLTSRFVALVAIGAVRPNADRGAL